MAGRPHPRAVAAWALACVVLALATSNPLYRVTAVIISLTVLIRLAGWRRVRRLLLAAGIFAGTTALLNVVVAHIGDTVLWTLPGWLPGLGGPWTLEALAYGLFSGVGLMACLFGAASLTLLLEPDELIDALPGWLDRTGGTLAMTLGLAGALRSTVGQVVEGQRLRGWRLRGPRSWAEITVPVVLTAVEGSIQLAEAMEARGYGAGPRSRWQRPGLSAADRALVAGSAGALVLFIAARVGGQTTEWYPYPSLSLPPLEPLPLAAFLLLALPLFLWPRRPSAT
ncbi:MAG: energy-coupling factor transporter transmembrane protein EcfT [Candidatus Dormibacteraeota bacterium]|nr:energy-coupling factor transporter transmembrane protein EcfT [Candidatus Dormibacteraeota bacterium]